MPQFTDDKGRTWKVKVTIPLLKRVRSDLDIDLGRPQAFVNLSESQIDVANVLYVLCRKQCQKREMTDEEFGECLVGDIMLGAWQALQKAYLDFCPSHQRDVLRKLLVAAEQTEQVAAQTIESRLTKMSELFKSRTSSPESAESARNGSHSES